MELLNPHHPSVKAIAKKSNSPEEALNWINENIKYRRVKAIERELKNGKSKSIRKDIEVLEDCEADGIERTILLTSIFRSMGKEAKFILFNGCNSYTGKLFVYSEGKVFDPYTNRIYAPCGKYTIYDDSSVYLMLYERISIPLLARVKSGLLVELNENEEVYLRVDGKNVFKITERRNGERIEEKWYNGRLVEMQGNTTVLDFGKKDTFMEKLSKTISRMNNHEFNPYF